MIPEQGAATPGSDPEGAGDPCALCGEDGSGTINSVALMVLALALAVVLGGVGAAHREQARLQAVADLAALAGAEQSASQNRRNINDPEREGASRTRKLRNSQEIASFVQWFPQVRSVH